MQSALVVAKAAVGDLHGGIHGVDTVFGIFHHNVHKIALFGFILQANPFPQLSGGILGVFKANAVGLGADGLNAAFGIDAEIAHGLN